MSNRNYIDLSLDSLTANKIIINNITSGQESFNVGTIIPSVLSEIQMNSVSTKYLLCDGRSCVGTELYAQHGIANTPNLQNIFTRGARSGRSIGSIEPSTTALPASSLANISVSGLHTHSGSTDSSGAHQHQYTRINDATIGPYATPASIAKKGLDFTTNTSSNGAHTHTISIDNAGAHTHACVFGSSASDTRPKNFAVNYFIKVNP